MEENLRGMNLLKTDQPLALLLILTARQLHSNRCASAEGQAKLSNLIAMKRKNSCSCRNNGVYLSFKVARDANF